MYVCVCVWVEQGHPQRRSMRGAMSGLEPRWPPERARVEGHRLEGPQEKPVEHGGRTAVSQVAARP